MDAPTLQAQLFPHISRSICLFKSVQSPKKPQGIEGGCSEFTGVFDKYSHQESLSSSIWDLGFGIGELLPRSNPGTMTGTMGILNNK
ncbi:MAG: hypothetical protein WBL95_04430 [Microcoleus sp.]